MSPLILAFALVSQADLPKAPEGVQVREVVKLGPPDVNNQPVRVRPHPKTGLFYVLYKEGDLWQVDAEKGTKKQVLERKAYLRKDAAPYVQALGLQGQFLLDVHCEGRPLQQSLRRDD